MRLAHNFDLIAICRGKCVAQRYSRRSRSCARPNFRAFKKQKSFKPAKSPTETLATQAILGELSSFLSLLRMASGLTQADSRSEQKSTATVKYASRFIASCLEIFLFEGF